MFFSQNTTLAIITRRIALLTSRGEEKNKHLINALRREYRNLTSQDNS